MLADFPRSHGEQIALGAGAFVLRSKPIGLYELFAHLVNRLVSDNQQIWSNQGRGTFFIAGYKSGNSHQAAAV